MKLFFIIQLFTGLCLEKSFSIFDDSLNVNMYNYVDYDYKNEIKNYQVANSILENSKEAISSFFSKEKFDKNNLFYIINSEKKQITNFFELIINMIGDKFHNFDKTIKLDSIHFLIFLQSIFRKNEKKLTSIRPNFIKYLIYYLEKNLKEKHLNFHNSGINKKSIEKILDFLLKFEQQETI